MNLYEITQIALATFYVSFVISQLDGPYKMFYKLRNTYPKLISDLTSCFYCLSIYMVVILYLAHQNGLEWLITILATAGIASLVHKWSE